MNVLNRTNPWISFISVGVLLTACVSPSVDQREIDREKSAKQVKRIETAHPKIEYPLTARGNEPGWLVKVEQASMQYRLMSGEQGHFSSQAIQKILQPNQNIIFESQEGAQAWRLSLTHELCSDTMTGMPYPYKALFFLESDQTKASTFLGCAGSSKQILMKATWQINKAADQTLSKGTLTFHPGNRVEGTTGCNHFFGTYELSGEGIRFTHLATTSKLCPADEMAWEQAILNILNHASHLSMTESGLLSIHGSQGTLSMVEAK